MKVWGRIVKNSKCINDSTVVIDNASMTRTKKVFAALEQLCLDLDLSSPIWLECNIKDFKKRSRTRFTTDSFIESIDFDYFDFYVIEDE